jgi:hypothetical protein
MMKMILNILHRSHHPTIFLRKLIEKNKWIDKSTIIILAPVRSALITAQIEMNPFLNMENNPCYYTDIDSLFLTLDASHIGKQLGKLDFKGIIKRG